MSEFENKLTEETQAKLKNISKSLLRLHKTLLDAERKRYELVNGKVQSTGEMLRLVLDDAHFAWLRILSGQIVLIDEFLASKQTTIEMDGISLIEQTARLLNFEDENENFGNKFQAALQNDSNSVISYNETLNFVKYLKESI
jgi:hypothetical protein